MIKSVFDVKVGDRLTGKVYGRVTAVYNTLTQDKKKRLLIETDAGCVMLATPLDTVITEASQA